MAFAVAGGLLALMLASGMSLQRLARIQVTASEFSTR
jgi:hypothetical protein